MPPICKSPNGIILTFKHWGPGLRETIHKISWLGTNTLGGIWTTDPAWPSESDYKLGAQNGVSVLNQCGYKKQWYMLKEIYNLAKIYEHRELQDKIDGENTDTQSCMSLAGLPYGQAL